MDCTEIRCNRINFVGLGFRRFLVCLFQHPFGKTEGKVQQDSAYEKLKSSRIGEIPDAEVIPEKNTGQGANGNPAGKGPEHSFFLDITSEPTWNADDIVQKICRTDRRRRKTENAHLKRQDQKGPGNPCHGGKKGDDKRDKGRQKKPGFDPGYGKNDFTYFHLDVSLIV